MATHNLSEIESRPVGRLLWEYSLPAVVGMLVMSLYNVIDRIFIGQGVGADAIAGLAITFPVMNLTAALGVMVGGGAAARVSIVLGQKDEETARLILGNALTLILINATIYIAFFGIFIDPILRLFGASDVTLPYARDFILWLLPGLLMTNLTYSLNNVMRASGYPRRAMFTMLIGAGSNLVLAPIFIFGFGLGIKGAAIATDLAMTISASFVFAHFFSKNVSVGFCRGTFRLRSKIVLAIISIGAAPALVNAASCFINIIINTTLGRYGGDTAIGAAGIFTTYTSLMTTIVLGICQGMQPIVGYNYGAQRYDRLRRTYWLAVAASTVICAVGSAFGLTYPDLVARVFTTDEGLIHMTEIALHWSLIAFSVVGFQIVSTTFFQSIGKSGKSIFLSLSRQVLFLIPLLLYFPTIFALDGIWMSFPTSDVIATLVTAFMIIWQFRRLRQLEIKN
jgi:putative MATE family efflux protein